MNIGKFSVSNPVLVNILMASLLFLGAFSYTRLPQQVMSNVDFSWVLVAYTYPGASAEEVEKSVVMKVEKEIKDLDRLKKITSTTRDGSGFMFVEFDDDVSGSEFSRLSQDLRADLDKVELPDDVPDPWINEFSSTDMMTILSINLINTSAGTREIQRTADLLKDRLLDIPNVSDVQIYGGRKKEIWIEVDRARMEASGVSLDEVSNAVKYRNMNIPGGRLEMGKVSYLLESRGAVEKPEDFGRIVVRSTPGGGSITVGDMASVNDGFAEAEYDARFNGTACVSLLLTRTAAGNEIRIVKAAKKIVDEFRQTLPKGISIELSNDNTFFIRDTLATLGRNALMGFALVVLVLMLFLGLRNSLITALGIPITFAITFIFMEWYGESLNGNSLFALVLVLGMIVDHAIVIIENSYRHRQRGLGAAEAAILGTNEVVWPVVSATATTLAAFLPLMLLPGIMGKFMRIVPIVVSLALFASTLEALIFLPAHFVEWGGRVKQEGTGPIGRFREAFKRLIARIYRHRWLTLGITATVIAASAALTRFVHEDLFAEEEWTLFFVNIELPIGTPRTVTDEVTSRFEQRILPYLGKGEIVSLTTTVGLVQTDDDWVERSSVAQITVDVAERKEGRKRPMAQIIDEIKKVCSDIPGAESVRFTKLNTGPPLDKPVLFRLSGDNYADMASIAADFKQMLAQYPELYNIDDNFDPGAPQLRIRLNEERARELGLSAAQLGMYVRNCFEGAKATTYFDEGEEIDVVVKLARKDRESMDALMQMKFPTPDGRMIPFSTVCSVERASSMSIIKHTDGKREVTVSADAYDKKNVKAIADAVQKTFKEKYSLAYPDVTLKMGGAWADFAMVFMDILRLFWIGLFLIYVILGAQFKSFFQPLIIMFTIPFAFVGCVIFLILSGTPVSITVLFAGVALAGIAVNDSIVLISFVNDLRRAGLGIAEAVSEAASVRLRPIVLTSVTTIGGLLPMAIGLGGKSATWGPMASTISFGLLFSTVGTLIVMPCAYGALNDTTTFFRRNKRSADGEPVTRAIPEA